MSKQFFASAKYKMKLPAGISGVAGGLIVPSGVARHVLERRNLERAYPHLARRLLDPQLYLAGLNVNTCRAACTNLASYGWLPGERLPAYDSAAHTQSQWSRGARATVHDYWRGSAPTDHGEIEATITSCIEAQGALGCEAIILPSPLTTDPGTSFTAELEWIDVGLDIAARVLPGQPRIPTLAVSDTCLRGISPSSNRLLDTIVDQVSARTPEGAYIVLEQANEDGYYCTHPNTVGSLLRLVHGLKVGGVSRVVVAFAGTAGLLALAVGADTWSTGWYRGERRLRLADFEQQEGRAMPAFYSHALAGEFHLESDLDRAVSAGFFSRLSDVTDSSEGLMRALAARAPVSSVPEWKNTQSNVTAAIEHFLTVMSRETSVLAALSATDSVDYAQRWLENADRLSADLFSVGSFNARTSLNHQRSWREAFANFLSSR